MWSDTRFFISNCGFGRGLYGFWGDGCIPAAQ